MTRYKAADAHDVIVGANVRRARRNLQLSQKELASACGISFQQVQKYENGINRVAASRLFQISSILDVTCSYLLDIPTNESSSPTLIGAAQLATVIDTSPDAAELLAAYRRIKDVRVRQGVRALIAALGAAIDREGIPEP